VETGSGVSDAGQKATVETGSLAERKRERERERDERMTRGV
jgi:hypothetical protein